MPNRLTRILPCLLAGAWLTACATTPPPDTSILFSDSFGESSRGELALNVIQLPEPEGLGYTTDVYEGYRPKGWIASDNHPGDPRSGYWVMPILPDGTVAEYMEQAGRALGSALFAPVPIPPGLENYDVQFRMRRNDNDPVGVILGAPEPKRWLGIRIEAMAQIPGTDDTQPDLYTRGALGESKVEGAALRHQWADHLVEVRGQHVRWTINGQLIQEGIAEDLNPAEGGYIGLSQHAERGTRYDDFVIREVDGEK